jgi:stage III sporulation protein AD
LEIGVFQIAVIGVGGCLTALLFSQDKKEYGILVTIAVGVIISVSILSRVEVIMDAVSQISGYISGQGTLLKTLFKMVGISYVSEFSAAICRDAGCQAVAVQIEMFGKIVILAMSTPLLLSLLESLGEFLL